MINGRDSYRACAVHVYVFSKGTSHSSNSFHNPRSIIFELANCRSYAHLGEHGKLLLIRRCIQLSGELHAIKFYGYNYTILSGDLAPNACHALAIDCLLPSEARFILGSIEFLYGFFASF